MTDPLAAAWEAAVREHEARLVVGVRVRVRLSDECEQPHEFQEDGVTGYIDYVITQDEIDIDNATATDPRDIISLDDLHIYSVTFDDPQRVPMLGVPGYPGGWLTDSLYAAAELQPLDAPPADSDA